MEIQNGLVSSVLIHKDQYWDLFPLYVHAYVHVYVRAHMHTCMHGYVDGAWLDDEWMDRQMDGRMDGVDGLMLCGILLGYSHCVHYDYSFHDSLPFYIAIILYTLKLALSTI